jgi:hypothetical protein
MTHCSASARVETVSVGNGVGRSIIMTEHRSFRAACNFANVAWPPALRVTRCVMECCSINAISFSSVNGPRPVITKCGQINDVQRGKSIMRSKNHASVFLENGARYWLPRVKNALAFWGRASAAAVSEGTWCHWSVAISVQGGRRNTRCGILEWMQAAAEFCEIRTANGCVASITIWIGADAINEQRPAIPPNPPMRVSNWPVRGALVRPASDNMTRHVLESFSALARLNASAVPPRIKILRRQ